MASIIHDVSKQQTAEKDLVKAKERAEESDKLKTAFLANMSHEIRTPLNGIIGFSSLLQKRELAEKKKNLYVNIIINNSQQLLNIVNDILDVSRIESGTLDLDFEEVNLNELIMDLYSSYKSQYNQKVVSLFTHKELKDENSYVITDKLRLIQVLSNLLYNSFKFTHEGYIKFGYTLDNGFVKFFVEDTGIGISKKMHDKIFEPFRQAETGITRKYGGTGLGLSISKKIINLLGGEIGLKSKVGKGSEFYFTIPLKLVKQTKANLEQTITENEDRNTILLVEDKESNFLLIEEILSEINLKILHAKNGKEAVEICRTNKNLKLVLMDLKMPIMNGYEATKLIKKDNPSLPVIAQSAYAMKEEKNKAQEYGFDAYISKPISQENLFIYIDKYINKK